MAVNEHQYAKIINELKPTNTQLIAVSKTKPASDIEALYNLGQRHFGENYVQELAEKQAQLPQDIHWHFIGHLQSNKVKYIAPFVQLIHGVDDHKLLTEINKAAAKNNRIIDCLLQVHIAQEETKFGLNEDELAHIMNNIKTNQNLFANICIKGLMGMASNTTDVKKIRAEFHHLKTLFNQYSSLSTNNCQLSTLSMGMSGDYTIAIEEGSTMIRIGSLLFGERNYHQ